MIKRGIWTIEQLRAGKLKGLFGDDKFVATDLYQEVISNPKYQDLQESVLMSMQDGRGAYKRTYENRFQDFDKEIKPIIAEHISSFKKVNILDLGVSDGRTAVDFYALLKDILPDDYSYNITDYSPNIKVIGSGRVKVVLDGRDNLTQIISPPFVLSSAVSKNILLYPVNLLALTWLKSFKVAPLMNKYKQGELATKEISLFNVDLQKIACDDKNVELGQYSVLDKLPFDKEFHIIRAMNLFNESYFSDEEFQAAFDNLKLGLADGGLLIIGSNNDANTLVNGNIFQKTKCGFKKIYKSGTGAPISNIAKYLDL